MIDYILNKKLILKFYFLEQLDNFCIKSLLFYQSSKNCFNSKNVVYADSLIILLFHIGIKKFLLAYT
ncbi:hypothetical protein BpHYR1_018703 [Brachionus plicatilis]|uniref:Uncharacterized protein n=1 Tax=Brachionus plicatilis TaxID=10195 RepID=A0A3M7Q205_BRAPC|nr:hypothetical protein BpHYR1_018703 [Brachionus plicatilis]